MGTFIDNIQTFLAPVLNISLFNNTLDNYFNAFIVFLLTYIILHLLKKIVLKKFAQIAEKTTTTVDDEIISILQGISRFFILFTALYINIKVFLEVDGIFGKVLDGIFIILAVSEAIKIAGKIFRYVFTQTTLRRDETTLNAITLIFKIVLWSIGILLILSNLGFNVSTLAASLGIGGIAVALAAQNILGDLFASFSIFFDKPFKIGDFIIIGTDKGYIKKIGLKSTRITTLQGEELIVSNKELTTVRIQNFKKMKKRRIVFPLGVVYGTPQTKLKKIKTIIQSVIDKEEMAEFERCHFRSFGDFSLNFEIMYYVLNNDYGVYLNTQEAINLEIAKQFEKENIEMAFPTQTIHMVKNT